MELRASTMVSFTVVDEVATMKTCAVSGAVVVLGGRRRHLGCRVHRHVRVAVQEEVPLLLAARARGGRDVVARRGDRRPAPRLRGRRHRHVTPFRSTGRGGARYCAAQKGSSCWAALNGAPLEFAQRLRALDVADFVIPTSSRSR